jgi:hypothetical protein
MIDIYQTLLSRGLCSSKRDFSTRWAGKSPSYLAMTEHPSSEVMLAVFRRLMDERRWLLAVRVARAILFDRGTRT